MQEIEIQCDQGDALDGFFYVRDDGAEIVEPDQVVIFEERIKIYYNYPLNAEVTFEHHHPEGVTRQQLVDDIRVDYEIIFANPDKYGVWGHDPDDLVVEAVQYDDSSASIYVEVGS